MYKRTFKRRSAALLFSSALFAVPAHADVTVGTPSMGGNCYPFSCGYTGEYQQVFASSVFANPTTINTVEFFPSPDFALNDNTSSFTLAFYLTAKPVDGLSTNPATNRTTLISSFGTFVPGTSYLFTGNSFTYDPSLGNLLLSISTAGAPQDSATLYYSAATGDAMSNLYRSGGTGAHTTSSNGLVTRFSSVTAVPEPSTWALMLLGFFAIGVVTQQKRKSAGRILSQIA